MGETDLEMACSEIQSMCDIGMLYRQWAEDKERVVKLYVDTASVVLHGFGVIDPRLAFGACERDQRQTATMVKSSS